MKKVSFLITDNNITVNYDGETHIVRRADVLSDRLIKALKENKLSEIPQLISTAKRIETFSKGAFVVQDGRVMINGVAAPEFLSNKIVKFSNEGLPFQPLLKFAEKLLQNPSFRAVNELYQFLEKNDHPITEEGNLIGFKKVRDDFTDVHTGTFDNHPGQTLEMPRNQVDENTNKHCSNGFHVGNWRYCHEFYSGNGIMLEVEVNPADVVSVPNDLNEKIRVCKYTVLGVIANPHDGTDADLRVVNQEQFDQDLNEEEENTECLNCGEPVYDDGDLCEDCAWEEDNYSCYQCEDGECCGECKCCEDEKFEHYQK